MNYLHSLLENKDKFFKCFTNCIQHFSNTTTFKSESGHAKLKCKLSVSTSDLKQVVDKITFLSKNKWANYLLQYKANKDCVLHCLKSILIKSLKQYVTIYALIQVNKQFELMKTTLKNNKKLRPCTRTFQISMGIPCQYHLKKLLNKDKTLNMNLFVWHWQYYKLVPSRNSNSTVQIKLLNSLLLPHAPSLFCLPVRSSQSLELSLQSFSKKPSNPLFSLPSNIDPLLKVQEPLQKKLKGQPTETKNKQTKMKAGFEDFTKQERLRFKIVKAQMKETVATQTRQQNSKRNKGGKSSKGDQGSRGNLGSRGARATGRVKAVRVKNNLNSSNGRNDSVRSNMNFLIHLGQKLI